MHEEKEREIELSKKEYAMSFQEYYEYDIVTVVNEGHGLVDKEKMKEVLQKYAKDGWKLHTMYSNELGKNAIRILGFGINSTACEDVKVFERRVEKM